jgi:cysteine desulfurase
MTRPIYLDYAASTPIDDRVVAAMAPFHGAANAASAHDLGKEAADAVERARAQIAELIGATPGEIVFTSGATEADNAAIGGVLRAAGSGHVVTTTAEHKAVLEAVAGWCRDATIVPVDTAGAVDPRGVEAALTSDTVLVTVMAANNEVGTISELEAIGASCRARDILFHTDAAQLIGKVPIDVSSSPIDLLSLSGHKIYGPKGIGALWVRRDVRHRLAPIMYGGGHERGLRPGTLNVAGCVGIGEAAEIAQAALPVEERRVRHLRTLLVDRIAATFPTAEFNGSTSKHVPGILNVRLPQVDAESLLLATPGIAASTGSACTSATPSPSHVLLAMGLDHEGAGECIRISLGRFTTTEDIEVAVGLLAASAAELFGSPSEARA